MVGGVKYSDLYIDSDDKDTSYTNSYVTSNDTGHDEKNILQKMPTLPHIARQVAKLEKTQLDEKQYIACEMIACTFFLGLVNDGHDENTKLSTYLQQTMEITSTADANDIIKKLNARGGREQLTDVSDRSRWFMKKHCHENCTAIL